MSKSVKKSPKQPFRPETTVVRSFEEEDSLPASTPRTSLRSMKTMSGGGDISSVPRKRPGWGMKNTEEGTQPAHGTPVKTTPRTSDHKESKDELSKWKSSYEAASEALKKVQAELKSKDDDIKLLESEVSELKAQLANQPKPVDCSMVVAEKDKEIDALRKAANDTEMNIREKVGKLTEVLMESDRRLRLLETERINAGKDLSTHISTLQDDISIAKFELEGLISLLGEMILGKGFPLAAIANRTLVLKDSGGIKECIEEMKHVNSLVVEVKETLTRVYFANRRVFEAGKSASSTRKSSPIPPKIPS